MKKLIAVATLFFAFTLSANAQDNKKAPVAPSSTELAKQDVALLVQTITINEAFKKDMLTLMTMKYDDLSNPKLSPDEKRQVSKRYEYKVMAGLTEEQRKELSQHPDVVQRLFQ